MTKIELRVSCGCSKPALVWARVAWAGLCFKRSQKLRSLSNWADAWSRAYLLGLLVAAGILSLSISSLAAILCCLRKFDRTSRPEGCCPFGGGWDWPRKTLVQACRVEGQSTERAGFEYFTFFCSNLNRMFHFTYMTDLAWIWRWPGTGCWSLRRNHA